MSFRPVKLLLALLLFAGLARAQTSYQNGGNITSAGATCTMTNCVALLLPANSATLTVGVTGTFSATLVVEESQDGGFTWTSAGSSLTTAGTSVYFVAGFTNFHVRASAFASGNAGVNLQASIAASGGVSFGSGPPVGTCTPSQQYVDTTGATLYICPAGTWVAVGSGGGGSTPRLDQVLDPNISKTFNLGTTTLSFTNGTEDLSSLTAPLKLPSIAGCTTTSDGQICFDSSNSNYKAYNGGIENFALFPSTVTDGHLAGFLFTAGKWTLQDLGALSGGASGGTVINATITNIKEGDSICWDAGLGTFVNCTEGVPPTIISAATYTVDCSTDRGSYLLFTSASPIAVTLPQASLSTTCDANFFTFMRTLNATLTITPTTSTIDDGGGAGATLVLSPSYGTSIFSDPTAPGFYYGKVSPFREGAKAFLSTEGFDVGTTGAYQFQIPNNAVTGTTVTHMVCDDGAGKGIICPFASSSTDQPLGVAVSGVGATPGTTGNTGIALFGYNSVIFDNSATANHFAQVSASVNGDLSDVGTTAPADGRPYYFVFSGNSGAGTAAVIRVLTASELNAAGIGGSGKSLQLSVNGTAITKPIGNLVNGTGITFATSSAGNTTTITPTVTGAAPTGTAGGDLSGSYPNPTVAQVNGAAVPLSAGVLGSNSSRQLIAATETNIDAAGYVAGGGSANAQTATLAPAITAYTNGLRVCWLPTAANSTTTPTLAVNGLTATTIVKTGGAALAANDLTTTAVACAVKGTTNFELQNPQTATNAGTVTSIATTSPITGGTINSTGTIACATCVTSAASLTSGQIMAGAGLQASQVSNLSGDVTTSGSMATTLGSAYKRRGISFTIGVPGGTALAVASTTTSYITVPIACTISGYNLAIDAGTITVKFWKVATGTAIPTSGNSISTSGVGISTGTAIHSTTVSDFTSTTVTANDIMAMNVTAVATAAYVNGVLQCDQP